MCELVDHLEFIGFKYKIGQIKEKFGGLRFYVDGESEYGGVVDVVADKLIHLAESQSFHICERCGDGAEQRTDLGWTKTLCDKHHQETLERQKAVK